MIAKGQITVTNIDDGKTPFLHQAYKMKDGRFLKHYPVYEASPVNGYKEGDLWHRTDGSQPGYFVAIKSNTTLNLNDWTFYANELAYSDTNKFYPKFEGTYSDYNEIASDDQTKYTWKIIKADDGIGIKSVKEYYAVSASNVTPPSLQSDWSETPKVTNTTNKYLWNYEVYTYSNGDAKETTKRVIGTHGTTGSTGNGITSVTNRYLATTLATGVTTATSGWTTAVQNTDPVKKYLWNYEEILYTSGSKIPTAPVIIGTHGEKGDNSVTGLLTNESITLPANKDGLVSVSSFTGANGVFDVYDGITKKTDSGVKYSLVSQFNITVSIDATTGAYSVTAMPTGTTILNGYAVLRAIYNGVTIDKQLNVSKSVTGAPGASSYTWIRYSPNANGSSMTTTPAANSLYIGVAITSSNSAPTAYTSYTWALIKGADGKGVKSAAITYQASTSGTVIPTGSWVTTVPTVPKGQYLWTRVITTYTDNTTSPPSYSTSYQGVDGITNVTGLLTNESITLPANVGGTVTSYAGATGTFDVYEGLTKKTTGSGVTYSVVPQSQSNIVVNINATTGVYTITSMTSGLAVLNGYATLRAIYNGVTIDKQINVTKAPTGATGAPGGKGDTGASATSYWITASNNIIGKSQTGVINPTTITFNGFSKTGTANSVAYAGRFIIQTSTNGTTYTTRYTTPSNTNESSCTYTIPADSLFIKCLFYMAGGTTVLLDEQTVPIVESAEGIQVGGRNLVLNTQGEHNPSLGGSNVYTLPLTDSSMFLGKELTFSFKAKSSNGTNKMYIAIGTGSQTRNKITEDIVIPIDYKEFKYTFIASTSTDTTKLMIVAGTSWFPDNDGSITITDIKLEKGNKATDWTPAPEDVDKAISTVQANLTVEAGKIASKVSQSEFDAVANRLDSAESTITQQANQITFRVTKTELTTAIDGIEVGTRNLLRDSNVEFSFGEDDNKYIWDAYRDNTWEVLGD